MVLLTENQHTHVFVFKIIKFRKGDDDKDLCVNGKCPYFRILIKKKIEDGKQ